MPIPQRPLLLTHCQCRRRRLCGIYRIKPLTHCSPGLPRSIPQALLSLEPCRNLHCHAPEALVGGTADSALGCCLLLPTVSLDAQMTFLGSERAAESAVAWRELGIVGGWAEVEVGVWAEVDVEPRGILFT